MAIKMENHEVRVMAIDSQPSEPFPARNGALVLAPGGRVDAFVDTATTASILLHDGKEAHTIGKLTISGRLDRRAPLLPGAAAALQRAARATRPEERPRFDLRARRPRATG